MRRDSEAQEAGPFLPKTELQQVNNGVGAPPLFRAELGSKWGGDNDTRKNEIVLASRSF